MNSTNFPDLYRMLSALNVQPGGMVGTQRFADGGPVPHFASGGLADWYQALYGPVSVRQTDAVDPYAAPIFGPSGGLNAYEPGGPGSTSSPNVSSGPTTGVNSTSNSAVQSAIAAAIGAVSPVPGVVAGLSTIANMLANVSTIGVPGIATVDENQPNMTVADALANVTNQTNNAVAAGIGTGNNAGQPGQPNAPGQANNVGPTPGIGMATQTAQQADVGGGAAGNGSTAAPGDPTADSGTDAGTWARGGSVHRGLSHAQRGPRRQIVRKGALAGVR